MLKGKHHDAHRLIDLKDYQKIQNRLAEGAKAPARANISADFPLRGFVLCGDCNHPLTACWSKSKNGTKHPYYLCHHKGCESYRKSIRRADIEDAFTGILKTLQPTSMLTALSRAMWSQIWDYRLQNAEAAQESAKQESRKLQTQIDGLLDRIVETENPSVVKAYETRIAKLEREKLVLDERAEKTHKPQRGFDEMFEHAMRFLSNPYKIWENGDLSQKLLVLRMVFAEKLTYHRKTGVRTPETTLPFKVLEGIDMGAFRVARSSGETSNQLFEVLEDWEEQLKHADIDFGGPQP